MTLWSSPHPKESAALSLSQAQKSSEVGKFKELTDREATAMPSSATSFASDGSEDAGFEDGSIDVDMGEEETDSIQIDCIQTLTELDPIIDGELNGTDGSPLMSDCKTPIPLPPPPVHIGSGAFGGNQAYVNMQNNIVSRIMERPTSPIQSYWNSSGTTEAIVHSSRTRGDVGLNNIGNTCFMNSGLQCLVHTSPLVEFFVRSDTFERTATSLIYQFNSLMNHIWFGEKGAISLHDFKLVLGNKYAQFKDCRQHDCQEFLAVLLDMLHEELKLKQKAALSVADSSIVESYEDCSSTQKIHEKQYSVATSYALSMKPDATDSAASPKSSNEQTEFARNKPRSSLPKRAKLENVIENDSSTEAMAIIHCDEPDEVKRKTPLSKAVENDKNSSKSQEKQDNINNLHNVNEARGSLDVRCGFDENLNSCPMLKAQTYWNKYMRENDTVIASTFQGMFKSAVTCSECSFISETYEPFMYLSLPIPRVMEKKLNVTYISMKDRTPMKVEVTIQLVGTVESLIQEVIKKVNNCGLDSITKYAVAEVFNHRVSRVLDDKSQLRSLSTNSRNIYVYELNDNFEGSYEGSTINDIQDPPPILKNEKYGILSVPEYGGRQEMKKITVTEWGKGDESHAHSSSDVSRSLPLYGPVAAPVGGGTYDGTTSSFANSSDDSILPQIDNDNFNRIQCNICLEDYPRQELKKHRGCSCVLCEECLVKSVEHFQSESEKADEGTFVKCAVCLQTVECKKAFASLDESSTLSSPEFITMPIIFRNEPGTDANNNSSWNPGLFGYPWLILVPSFLSASELTDFVESINPVPEANHRLLSVKSDGKSCGQCVFSTRCNGCEIPREGMISLNSCNSIMISFIDLPSEQMENMQPPDMALHNELSASWQFSRNEEPTIDIHDCLRTFSETEHLDEQNPWYCPRCEKNQRATKSLSICRFPDYLIVYLKRFVFLDQSSNKLNNRLTFPINDLDVSDYVTEGFGTDVGKYNLYSCVCHFGSASAGHYTAYAKNPVTNQWHYFNDDNIMERAPADNEYSSAYVLFYEKKGMDCNIPTKCSKPLPELNSFNTTLTYNADTRGSYLPGETNVSAGPVRVNDFMNDNLQVDSTSPNFSFPHLSTEADLLGLEDEGVGNETNNVLEIHDGLDLPETETVVVTSSTSGPDDDMLNKEGDLDFDNFSGSDNVISTSTPRYELPTSSGGGADSTSN